MFWDIKHTIRRFFLTLMAVFSSLGSGCPTMAMAQKDLPPETPTEIHSTDRLEE